MVKKAVLTDLTSRYNILNDDDDETCAAEESISIAYVAAFPESRYKRSDNSEVEKLKRS